MASLPFFWIDAFVSQKSSGGNPCAVVLNADSLTSQKMQSIALEINLSETAFVMSSNKADFAARYFTPDGELPFAGHPTIATIFTLVEAGLIKISEGLTQVTLELPAGIIPIDIESINNELTITMSQLTPKFQRTYTPEDICRIFGLEKSDLIAEAPIQTVNTGTPILMIPMSSHEALKKVKFVDYEYYEKIKAAGDFFFPHHFCLKGATSKGTTFARSLGTITNPLEDPFTGSATGCMAAYLWKYAMIPSAKFIAEQGHWMGRPGTANVQVVGEKNAITTIRLSGKAICIISGTINADVC